jgi:hypothetical protein
MPTDEGRRARGRHGHAQGGHAAVGALVVLALLGWLWLEPLAVLSAPAQQQAPTVTPLRLATGTPREATGTVVPPPTGTRADKPLTGLVLVPLNVKAAPPTPGNAPDLTAIRGQVVDYSGQGLWGQVVKVTRGQASQTAVTNDAGFYEVDGLVPGVYSVVVDGQICTPAENLKPEAGGGLQVDFGQIRTAATAIVSTRTGTPLAATPTRTPVPAEVTPTTTPTPKPTATPAGISRWWTWIGIDVDTSALGSSLFLGVMGGALLFAIGIVVGLIRR